MSWRSKLATWAGAALLAWFLVMAVWGWVWGPPAPPRQPTDPLVMIGALPK